MEIGGTFMKLFKEGGPVMYPLLIFSILGLVFIIERAIALRKAKINVNEFLARIRKALKEDVEKTIENAALFEMGRLERNLVWLATIANVSPLLGFFGTVAGMIKSFDALAEAGLSNPGLVAAGISEALITTAAGLAVAIPAQLAYNFFMSKINKFVRDIEISTNMLLETFGEMQRSGITPEPAAAARAAATAPTKPAGG